VAYSPQWVGVAETSPSEQEFGSTKGLGTPVVIDKRTNAPFYLKDNLPVPLGFGDYRSVSSNAAVLDTDSAILATADGVSLTLPPAADFPDGHFLHFYLNTVGSLEIVFASGDSILGQ
jgi:hypothetical protein